MIKDKQERLSSYKGAIPHWEEIQTILSIGDLKTRPPGKVELEDSDCFFVIADYESKPFQKERFEIHKKYIDLQIVLEGEEIIYNAPAPLHSPDADGYNAEKDIQFGSMKDWDTLIMRKDDFALLFPGDAHLPGCRGAKGPSKVRKLVIKIPVLE